MILSSRIALSLFLILTTASIFFFTSNTFRESKLIAANEEVLTNEQFNQLMQRCGQYADMTDADAFYIKVLSPEQVKVNYRIVVTSTDFGDNVINRKITNSRFQATGAICAILAFIALMTSAIAAS